jgi:hypothetical protein
MEISLGKSLTYKDQATRLVNYINDIISSSKFDYIVIPMGIFNIIEHWPPFYSEFKRTSELEEKFLIGRIYDTNVFLDLSLTDSNVYFYYNKDSIRNKKIDKILNNVDFHNNFHIRVIC